MFWKRPAVLLIGPVNAGKSQLFNTLTESKRAVVSSLAGTTRDINAAAVQWRRKTFTLLDSGGVANQKKGDFEDLSMEFLEEALPHVDLVLFVFDGKLPVSSPVKKIVREYQKKITCPMLLVLNKIDGPAAVKNIDPAWYRLGIGQPHIVSAVTGKNTGDLLDEVFPLLDKAGWGSARWHGDRTLKLALIGQPNVGKSSLLNALSGKQRSMVSPLPHTTRDWQDIMVRFHDKNFTFIDTAGLRKRARLYRISRKDEAGKVEKETVLSSLAMIEDADVVLFVIDASGPLSAQDIHLAKYISDQHKPLIILGNKWDLVKDKTPQTVRGYEKSLFFRLPFLDWAPVLFTSAPRKIRIYEVYEEALKVYENFKQQIPVEQLHAFLDSIIHKSLGKLILNIKQTRSSPPSFFLTTPPKKQLPQASIPWIEKEFRRRFNFRGTPILISTRKVR